MLVGALFAPGKRTVASALQAVGVEEEPWFRNCHRVLGRAIWSSRQASRVLLMLLVEIFALEGPLMLDVDETLERRQSKRITKGPENS